MKEHHYVYQITYSNGKKYIGSRSSKVRPEEDTTYIGSSKHTPNTQVVSKDILGTFCSRALAYDYEKYLQEKYSVTTSDSYYNRSIQTSTKFSTKGLTKENCTWVKQSAEKKKLYVGENQTAKQKAGRVKAAQTATGQKVPTRGKPGINSLLYKPWYIRDLQGDYHDMSHITMTEFLTSTDLPFSRGSIFTASRVYEHVEIPSGLSKGYIVGFLPIPKNHLIVLPVRKTDPWWFKTPEGVTTTVYSCDRVTFCRYRKDLGLSISIINRGVNKKNPLAKGPFKGWSFGLITDAD